MGMSRDDLMELADECGYLEDPEEKFLREMEEAEAEEEDARFGMQEAIKEMMAEINDTWDEVFDYELEEVD